MVGTADEWTPRAVAFSREAERMGASGVMVVPPYYASPTEDELFEHYRRIAGRLSAGPSGTGPAELAVPVPVAVPAFAPSTSPRFRPRRAGLLPPNAGRADS